MIQTKAVFERKESDFAPRDCVIEKVIRLSGAEYDRFTSDMLSDQDFIKENTHLCRPDSSGRLHCLLVVGEDRRDGVLVDPSGYDYARYSAFIPNAEDFLTVGQSPSLTALNQKLTGIVDGIVEQAAAEQSGERAVIDLRDLETRSGIDLMTNGEILNTVLDMLGERPEITDFEIDKNELIIYRGQGSEELADAERDGSLTPREDFEYWQSVTDSSRFKWIEDAIFRLNGHGAFYYVGGEDGVYIKAHKDGRLEAGTYEGAIPHIGEAFFTPKVEQQYKDFNEAFTAAVEVGGKQFLVDMFSGNDPAVSAKQEKPSVTAQIRAARQTPHAPKDKETQRSGKGKGGPEL